ncbi:MAG: PEP-utilizing enzyme [Endomicrobia bacterium]|nr:PEP-utilizing enzyme [Endomicrobiia bacterium]
MSLNGFPTKTFGNDKLEAMFYDKENVSVAVTGGFHTEELKQILVSKGLSVLVLTPKINTEVKTAEKIYIKQFNEQEKAQTDEANINAFALLVETGYANELQTVFMEIAKLHKSGVFGDKEFSEIILQTAQAYNKDKEDKEKISIKFTEKNRFEITTADNVYYFAPRLNNEFPDFSPAQLIKTWVAKSKEFQKMVKKFGKKAWFQELFSRDYDISWRSKLTPESIEKLSAFADTFNVNTTYKLASFITSNKIPVRVFKRLINKYKWIQDFASKDYEISAEGVKNIDTISSYLGDDFNLGAFAGFAGNKIPHEKFKEIIAQYGNKPWFYELIKKAGKDLTADAIKNIDTIASYMGDDFSVDAFAKFAGDNIIRHERFKKIAARYQDKPWFYELLSKSEKGVSEEAIEKTAFIMSYFNRDLTGLTGFVINPKNSLEKIKKLFAGYYEKNELFQYMFSTDVYIISHLTTDALENIITTLTALNIGIKEIDLVSDWRDYKISVQDLADIAARYKNSKKMFQQIFSGNNSLSALTADSLENICYAASTLKLDYSVELYHRFGKNNKIIPKEFKRIVNEYKKYPEFREIFSGKYRIYELSAEGLENIGILISKLGVKTTPNLVDFGRYSRISPGQLKKIIKDFKGKKWFEDELFSGKYRIPLITADGIRNLDTIESYLGVDFDVEKFYSFALGNEIDPEKFKKIIAKYQNTPWFYNLLENRAEVTAEGIENVGILMSELPELNNHITSSAASFAKNNKIDPEKFKETAARYKENKLFQKMFLEKFDLEGITIEAIELIIKLVPLAGPEHYKEVLDFARKLKSHEVKIQYPKYVPGMFLKEAGYRKEFSLTPLASKLHQTALFAPAEKKEKYLFAGSSYIDVSSPEMRNIVEIIDLFSPSETGEISFLDYNEKSVNFVNTVSDKQSLNTALGYFERMIEIMSLFAPAAAKKWQREYKTFKNGIKEDIRKDNWQKIRKLLNEWLFNGSHEDAVKEFVGILNSYLYGLGDEGKDANAYFSNLGINTRPKEIKIINLSKDGKINSEIMKMFRTLMAADYEFDINKMLLKDNLLFWSYERTSTSRISLKADFSQSGRGISVSFYEGDKGTDERFRLEYMKRVLEKLGFSAVKYEGETLGIDAKLDKDTGLNNDADLANILAQTICLFKTLTFQPYFLFGKTYTNKDVDLYVRNFFAAEFNGNAVNYYKSAYPPLKRIQNKLNTILQNLGLEVIKDDLKKEYDYNPQSVIDKYFNEPLERAYAEGRIILNENGQLEKNENYDVIAEIAGDLQGENRNNMFEAGSIINQIINPRYFKFQEVAKLGGQNTLQTGYIQLEDGDYLSVKAVVSKRKTIKAAKVRLASDRGRPISAAKLIERLTQEGYENLKLETISKSEQNSLINALKQEINITKNLTAATSVTSEGTSETFAGEIIVDADRTKIKKIIETDPQRAKRLIWAVPYTTPDDMEILNHIGAVLTLGGGYTSHAAIETRNREKPSMVLKRAVLQKDNMVEISSVKPAGEIRNINGIQAQTAEGIKITLKTGDKVSMNRKLSMIEFLDPKTVLPSQSVILREGDIVPAVAGSINNKEVNSIDSATIAQNDKVKTPLNELSIAEIIKTFKDLKLSDKEKNGNKGWNLAVMRQEVFKDENIIPDGLVLDKNAVRYYVGSKGLEFDRLEQEISSIIADGSLSFEEKKSRIEPRRNAIKELIREAQGKEKQAKKLTDAVIKMMKKLNIKAAAFRSAGEGEDDQTHPFAGMGETKKKVKREQAPKAIPEILEAFYSDRAIEYMINSGTIVYPAMAIQDWEDFEKSGVAILDGDILTINAAYGDCEGIVGNKVASDEIKVRITDFEKGAFEILDYEPEDKEWKIITNEYGTSELVKAAEGRKIRIFSKEDEETGEIIEIREIVRAILKIRKKFNFDPDIEFGFNANKKYKVVQARANTAKANVGKSTEPEQVIPEAQAQELITMFISGKTQLTNKDWPDLMRYAVAQNDQRLANEIMKELRQNPSDDASYQKTLLEVAQLLPSAWKEEIITMPSDPYADTNILRIQKILSAA